MKDPATPIFIPTGATTNTCGGMRSSEVVPAPAPALKLLGDSMNTPEEWVAIMHVVLVGSDAAVSTSASAEPTPVFTPDLVLGLGTRRSSLNAAGRSV